MILHPLANPPKISQSFGQRPEVYKKFGLKAHNGLDYIIPEGTPLLATHDGIAKVGFDKIGYGNYIYIIDKVYGKETVLGHCSKVIKKDGERVYAGEVVAYSGNTGFSEAPHLHFGFRRIDSNGKVIDYNNGYFGYIDLMKIKNSIGLVKYYN